MNAADAGSLATLLIVSHTAALVLGLLSAHLVDNQHCHHHHHVEDDDDHR